MEWRNGKHEEEVMVSPAVESAGVRRTRPGERAKEKELEERENMIDKGDSEEREYTSSRT